MAMAQSQDCSKGSGRTNLAGLARDCGFQRIAIVEINGTRRTIRLYLTAEHFGSH
jgi:hypothetical protein